MCTIHARIDSINPKFVLYNMVFSSSRAEMFTARSLQRNIRRAGIELSIGEIENSLDAWKSNGMIHSEGESLRVGSC